jgi:hypothetical protein
MLLSETLDAGVIDFFETTTNAAAIPAMTTSAAAIAIQRAPTCRAIPRNFFGTCGFQNSSL